MSEVEVLENGEQPEGEIENKEEKKPFNGYIDLQSQHWQEAPDAVREEMKERLRRESHEKSELKRKLEERDRKLRENEEKMLELRKPKEVEQPDPDLALEDPEEYRRQNQAYLDSREASNNWRREKEERDRAIAAQAQKAEAERLQGFIDRGEKKGISYTQIHAASEVVKNHMSQELGNFIVSHTHGPEILVKLAENPLEVQTLASLSPYEAGVKLKELADSFAPSTKSNAPPPDDPVKGSGPSITKGFAPEGATFE